MKSKVLLIEDDSTYINLYDDFFRKHEELEIEIIKSTKDKSSLLDFLEKVEDESYPDIAILDIRLGTDNTSRRLGVQLGELLFKRYEDIKVVVVSSFIGDDTNIFRRLHQSGAGFAAALTKDEIGKYLYHAIKIVQDGGSFLSPRLNKFLSEMLPAPEPFLGLEPKAHSILLDMVRGLSNSEICEKQKITSPQLATSKRTIKDHFGLIEVARKNNDYKEKKGSDVKVVLEAIKRGDPEAIKIFEDYTKSLLYLIGSK